MAQSKTDETKIEEKASENENKKEDAVQDELMIGSWNVHAWKDGSRKENVERILAALKQTPCDILCIQEIKHHANLDNGDICESAETLMNSLNYKYQSKLKKFDTDYGVKLLTKSNVKIIETKTDNVDNYHSLQRTIQCNILNVNNGNNGNDERILLFSIHLHYMNEEIRLNELKTVLKLMHENINNKNDKNDLKNSETPIIMLGDFNSLTQRDYTEKEWMSIAQIRAKNAWEKPKTQVTDTIVKKWGFHDCLHYLYQNNKKEESKDNENETLYASQGQWNNVLNGNLGTCRFDTRIDYVFVNDAFLKLYQIVKIEHLKHNDASDHVLVRVHCKPCQ